MRFFILSDIHSYYSAMKAALDAAGFDPNNSDHWLISCGDAFDRGSESKEVLSFLMSLERKILVKGNHDSLLDELCMREFPYSHDFSNGTTRTVNSIGGAGGCYEFDICCQRTWNITAAYRASLVNYFETENYIFVHSWIPVLNKDGLPAHYLYGRRFEFNPEWRQADQEDWDSAMWGNPFLMAERGLNQTGKTIVFGHWHASWPRATYEGKPEFDEGADFSPYYGDGYIAIDACTAASGKVNVLVIDDNFLEKEGK